jgi:acetyltransferase-like isoleucine patch superfamily enzyme
MKAKMSQTTLKYTEETLSYITNHIVSRILISSIRLYWYRHVMGFKIGKKSSILPDFKVAGRGNIKIGNHCVINNSCRFDNRFPIKIGNNVSITYGTSVITKGHDVDDPLFRTKGEPVVIEDYVWIAAFVIILPGVTLKQGAVVLPGSVVTCDVEAYHIVGGNPAKFVRERSRNLVYELNWDPWLPFWG